MDASLSDEHGLLRDSAAALIARHGGPRRGPGFDRAAWRRCADAGWLDVLVPEAAGGPGLGAAELALILEQAGRGLLRAPLGAVNAAALALVDGDAAGLRRRLLPAIAAGERVVIPALSDPGGGAAAVRAVKAAGRGLLLTGEKRCVPDAAGADGYLIDAAGPAGPMLCHVPAAAPGVSRVDTPEVDGGAQSRLRLDDVLVPAGDVLAGPDRAVALSAALCDLLAILTGAELLGVMGRALELALDHLKVRRQFDRPIGSFQALQHRAVDDRIAVELTRALLFQVCAARDEGRATSAMASAVKARASGAALAVTKSAIQMHGAVGFADEHEAGLCLKRAMTLSARYGNEAAHRRRYARLTG